MTIIPVVWRVVTDTARNRYRVFWIAAGVGHLHAETVATHRNHSGVLARACTHGDQACDPSRANNSTACARDADGKTDSHYSADKLE